MRDLAEICLNGKSLATLWKLPYRVDVTSALKIGANQLEIKVTNEWTNRQIGDRLAPPDRPAIGVTLYTPAKATAPVPTLVSISFNFGAGRGRPLGPGSTNGANTQTTGAVAQAAAPASGRARPLARVVAPLLLGAPLPS